MKITLNLIPPFEKERLRRKKQLRMLVRWEFALSALLVIFILTLVSVNYIFSLNISLLLAERGQGAEYKKIEELQNNIKEINADVLEVEKIQKGQLYWTRLGELLNRSIPDGIMLKSVATKNYGISLSGKSDTRGELVKLKEALEKEECVSELNFPLSNLISKEDVDFQIDFKIKKECLLLP